MNRKQKRAFIKEAKNKGISDNAIETFLSFKEMQANKMSSLIEEGEKVRLDVERIKGLKDYNSLNPKYKEFVESNTNTVFTAHLERGGLISLKEQPEWVFWDGALKRVNDECAEKI